MNKCIWCRKIINPDEPIIEHPHHIGRQGAIAHLHCEETAFHRHVGYNRFFLGGAVFLIASFAICTLVELPTEGLPSREWLSMMIGGSASAISLVKISGAPLNDWRERIEQAKIRINNPD